MVSGLERLLLTRWYASSPGWCWLLWPFSLLVTRIAARRLANFRHRAPVPPVPVLVVGNITVGGTGKTPLVIALCQAFTERGLKVVVISRGQGSRAPVYPFLVAAQSSVQESGDEPLLIALRTRVPVIIDAERARALEKAVADFQPDIVISDDGLQHYQLPRTAELVVVDGARGLGNGLCLPAGPLREAATRLAEVNWVVVNGTGFTCPGAIHTHLVPGDAVNLVTGATLPLKELAAQGQWRAVAGIGNPERFFATLEQAGVNLCRHVFPDHHAYQPVDLEFDVALPVIMTEKDAVKCRAFARAHDWYLPVTVSLETSFVDAVLHTLGVKS